MSGKKGNVRYEINPFLDQLVVPETNKQVVISPLGKDNNVLVNQETGEITGTSVVTYRRVDEEEFVKIFVKNIALTFDLSSAGIKALNVLLYAVQRYCIGRDRVSLDIYVLEEFLKENPNAKLSYPTFRRGITELENMKIIAKTLKPADYFINPSFVFNGNRIKFTTLIEKEIKETGSELHKIN